MKISAFVLTLFAVLSTTLAFKNSICSYTPFKEIDGGLGCRMNIEAWSYVAESNKCVEWEYGGCDGNDNRFQTPEKCEEMCKE